MVDFVTLAASSLSERKQVDPPSDELTNMTKNDYYIDVNGYY